MVWFVSSRFWTMFAGGHRRPIELCPTKLSMVSLGYPGWSPGRTCARFETFDCHGTWLTQEPPSRFSVASGPSLELCSKWFQTIVRFSQSELLPISSDGTVAFCKDKKEFFYIGFLALSSNFSCQTLGDCLCTPDAFHISNSIRYFWASVCVCVCSCLSPTSRNDGWKVTGTTGST